MTIEIRGVGFVNKGAELMLYAILDKVKQHYPNAKFVMAPNLNVSPYQKRAQLCLYQKLTYEKAGLDIGGLIGKIIPKKQREMYGLILDNEIDIVLDASGFAHGDQWSVKNTKKLLNMSKRWKNNNTKLILLPQAFGPFNKQEIAKNMKELIDNTTLIFAREDLSYNYITSITDKKNIIENMPDFTNLINGIKPDTFDSNNYNFCIIPNYKMVNKNWTSENSGYINMIVHAINYLREKGKKPFILVHEGEKDMKLAKDISSKVNGIDILFEEDPLNVKGIIGSCEGVIGSRFHSLVSALSQAIPTLGTSWSHKYQMLFKDYGFEEGIIDLNSSNTEIEKKIDILIEEQSMTKLKSQLQTNSIRLKQLSNEMWNKVFEAFEK
jgi:polysaccharide pyruvyl transferase WcaK-like protein